MVQSIEGTESKNSQQIESEGIVSNSKLDEKELSFVVLQKGKKSDKESKEISEKAPELENKNFSIDSTNRTEITDPNGVKVKENPEGDAREYLEGDYKGEQLFTQESALREANKAGKILPASWTTYRDIIEEKYRGNYQDFLKGEKIIFPGWYHSDRGELYEIGKKFSMRCRDGSSFNGDSE
ncbi:MAG: hypothetical protein WC875_05830 [Candidatus Absconditabacterales bacterium]